MISLKEGVDLRGLQPPLILGMIIVDSFLDYRRIPCLITSVCDSAPNRIPNSLHKTGLAFDVRATPNIAKSRWRDIILALRLLLGSQFDIIHHENHLHIEFDPKNT